MKHLATLISCALLPAISLAQTTVTDSISNDSIASRQLREIVVEGRNSRLGAEVSTYLPTAKQKNAAQSATDLLNRMAIPQLRVALGDAVTDIAGKPVDIFIDYMPASKQDLKSIRATDVKRVEYYDFPSDPRFQGKAHVVNFVMQQYEYGGYVKPYLERSLGAGTAQWALFNRLQYKRMTFDLAFDGFYKDQKHIGSDMTETFRLPQPDGSVRIIDKQSTISSGRLTQRDHYAYFKCKYKSEALNMQHSLMLNLNRKPRYDQSGTVAYSDPTFLASSYVQESRDRAGSVKYDGYIFYKFDDANTLSSDPQYAYSHTNTSSLYYEDTDRRYLNGARDDTHEFMVPINFDHSFGDSGELHIHFRNYYSTSDTRYTGTAESNDSSDQLDLIAGARFTLSKGNFYGYAGVGYYWDRTNYGPTKVKSGSPWADFSLQYSPNNRNTATLEYHYMSSCPEPNYFSDNVISKGPLMSITGNPRLSPYHCNDLNLSYSFVPDNRYSLSAFASLSTIGNRYVLDYTASPTGILRKVIQPGGSYLQLNYGMQGTARLLKNKLQVTASAFGTSWHNGSPYNQDKTKFYYYVQALYYLGHWNFGALYYSKSTYPDGFTTGLVIKTQPTCYLSAGWSNSKWNVLCMLYDFTKWNHKSRITLLHSQAYDAVTQTYSQADHCFMKITAFYTFGFGKKVERGNDSIHRSSISSGILK